MTKVLQVPRVPRCPEGTKPPPSSVLAPFVAMACNLLVMASTRWTTFKQRLFSGWALMFRLPSRPCGQSERTMSEGGDATMQRRCVRGLVGASEWEDVAKKPVSHALI